MENKELLGAISQLLDEKLDEKLEPIKEDISGLKEDVSNLKEDVSCLKEDVARLDARQTKMELIIENEIRPDIKLLAENYVPAAKMYREQADKIEAMQTDIALMKSVIREHSEILQRAALA